MFVCHLVAWALWASVAVPAAIVLPYLADSLLKCECRYVGDGDWLECERCILLGRKR